MLEKPEKKKIVLSDSVSCSVSWVDGRCVFKPSSRFSQFYYGICSYGKGIWAITPRDYQQATMITSIDVAPYSGVCSRAKSCFHFKCHLNRFTKKDYISEFADMGAFTLGLPQNIEREDALWFNKDEYENFWAKFILPYTGGILKYDENKKG